MRNLSHGIGSRGHGIGSFSHSSGGTFGHGLRHGVGASLGHAVGRGLNHGLTHRGGSYHGTGYSHSSHRYGHVYVSGYGHHNDFHYPNYVRHSLRYPLYEGYGYSYPSYSFATYIYPPIYDDEAEVDIEPAYDVLDDDELDEAVNRILKTLPAIEEYDDSIGAEPVPDADLPASSSPDDIALWRPLIEPNGPPEALPPLPEADSDESFDAQEGAADPQRANESGPQSSTGGFFTSESPIGSP